jgi:hypothetical protein
MRKAMLLILIAGLILAGCEDKPQFTAEEMAKIPLAQRDGLPEASGGFTLAVGDQTVTSEEVIGPVFEKLAAAAQRMDYEKFKQVGTPAIEQQLMTRIADAILYSKAKKEGGDKLDEMLEAAVTAENRKFVGDFGGDYAKAEQSLRQMGMDWNKFNQYQRKRILSQSHISQQLPSKDLPITYSEMMDVYEKTKEQLYATRGQVRFGLIDIEPAKLRDIDANRPRNEQAAEIANGIMKRVKNGENFVQIANEYLKQNNGITAGEVNAAPESIVAPYDVLAKKAAELKPGYVAGPIEAGGHIFLMQLIEYKPGSVEPFEKVQNQVKARISVERMRKAIDKLNEELVQQASAAERTKFVDFCLREIYKDANK